METPLKLIINGTDREFQSADATLPALLRELEISVPHFAVAINFQVIPKTQYETTLLHDGDKIEIVHAVGGG